MSDGINRTNTTNSSNMEKDSVIQANDIDNIIRLLDSGCESGISRIKVIASDEMEHETVKKEYHHGRCDVGSVFAKGMKNVSCD